MHKMEMKLRIRLKNKKTGEIVVIHNSVFDASNGIAWFEIDRKLYDLLSYYQYTGLKSSDVGGMPVQDLYFGDIIRFYTTDGEERRAEVIWYELEQCIGFKRLLPSDGFVYTQRHFNDSGYIQPSKLQFEIIGDIYKPPYAPVITA